MDQSNSERDELEVLASEFMAQLRRGETPAIEAYAAAHPALAAEIRDLFPTIAATEQAKVRHTRAGRTSMHPLPAPGRTAPLPAPGATAALPQQPAATAEAPPPIVRTGMTLGKYALQERIGQGCLGTVWRSAHPELGIPLAIKVLRPELMGRSEEQVQRFLREARTAAQLNHPHVVRVFDAGCDQGLYFLAMEYVEGGSLGELLRQAGGRLTVPRAVEIVSAMADALQAAAEFGIVHRDIKPDNILLDRKGTPKLADLGLAKQLTDADQPELTGTGVGLGTPLYVAPEQAMGEGTSDARADIYSLGATLYHLVTGAPPFTGATAYQIVHRHAQDPLVDPRERNPEIKPELAAIIRRMLAKDPNDRYPNAQALREDLARLAAGQAPAPWRPSRPAASRPRWLLPAAAAAAVVVVGTVLVLWAVSQQHDAAAGSAPTPPPSQNVAVTAATPAQPAVAPRPEAGPGSVTPGDWELSEGAPGPDLQPAPLKPTAYEFTGGVLRIRNTAVRHPSTLVYEPAIPDGSVTIVIEARNLVECGFLDAAGCRIVLQDSATPPTADGPWETIEIRRAHGELTCTVDGKPVYAIERPEATRGRFLIPLPRDGDCEIRNFAVSPGKNSQPAPPRGKQPPRRDNPPPHDDAPPPPVDDCGPAAFMSVARTIPAGA